MAACAMKAPAGKIKGVLFDIDGTLFDSGGRSVLQFLLFA
jgi:FMN phosphatase YigB (HAD superfamily)